jgi:hypothetical protein
LGELSKGVRPSELIFKSEKTMHISFESLQRHMEFLLGHKGQGNIPFLRKRVEI